MATKEDGLVIGAVWCGTVCRRRCYQKAMAGMSCTRVMQNGRAVCLSARCVWYGAHQRRGGPWLPADGVLSSGPPWDHRGLVWPYQARQPVPRGLYPAGGCAVRCCAVLCCAVRCGVAWRGMASQDGVVWCGMARHLAKARRMPWGLGGTATPASGRGVWVRGLWGEGVGAGGVWHKAWASGCWPLAAPIGLSPLLILTLCGAAGGGCYTPWWGHSGGS